MAIGTVTKLVILAAFAAAAHVLIRRALGVLESTGMLSEQAEFVLRGTAKWSLILLAVLVGLHTLGLPVSNVWTAISAVLVLVAVGFVAQWSILSNSLCAVFLVIYSPFRIGDEIELIEPAVIDTAKPGLRGRVVDISLLFTTIIPASIDPHPVGKVYVRVPNNMFFQKAVLCRPGLETKSLREALGEQDNAPR